MAQRDLNIVLMSKLAAMPASTRPHDMLCR